MIRAIINPDEDEAAYIKKQLKDNNMHRLSACNKNKETKCKCRELKEQIERGELGYCECGLYLVIDDGE